MGDWGRDWEERSVVKVDGVGSVHEKTRIGWVFDADTRGGHVWVSVRCGPTPGQRPMLGHLVMSVEEWEQFREMILAGVEAVVDGDVEVSG